MNTTVLKDEAISVFHTFIAVLIPILLANLNSLDFSHLSKELLISFAVGVLRAAVKATWNKLMPQYMLASSAR